MPVTLPAHPAAVLPLKLRWPKRFDGVALTVGSIAPDLAYAFLPAWDAHAHDWPALAYWSLPVTLLLTALVRRALLPAATRLPDLGALHLRDLAVSAHVRHRFAVTAYSALAGAASHIAWDLFTHANPQLTPLLERSPVGVPWFKLLQYGSGAAGTAVALWCALHIGRHRLLRRWHGDPPHDPAPGTRRWWPVFALIALPAATAAVLLPGGGSPHVLMARWIWCAVVAGVLASVSVAVAPAPRATRSRSRVRVTRR